jgi:hypothetical protein
MTRSMDVAVTGGSRLELFPARVKQEAHEFILGRPATGSYVALSGGALAATELLRDGRSIAEAKAVLARKHEGQEIRLRPLLETLLAAGLVKTVDNTPLPEPQGLRSYHLTWLRRRHVAWAFSWPAAAGYASLVGVGLAVALAEPRYLPHPAHAIVLSSPVLNLLLVWGVSMIALTAHELAHLGAAAFLGVRASFAISNRLVFPVAQTDLTDLWLVDRRRRYLAYVAGMMNDVLLACAAVTALWLHDQHLLPLSGLLYRTLRMAVLVLACGVVWQFNVYLRTDVYYCIANFTGCRNLSRDAAAYLKATLKGLLTGPGADPLAGIPERERPIIRAFAVLMVLGTAAVAALGAAYLGGLLILLFGTGGALGPAAHQTGLGSRPSPLPALASLGLTCSWLAYAALARRRGHPRVRFRLLSPDDL